MILVSKVWFSGILNPFQRLKNSLIITKTQKLKWLSIDPDKITENINNSLSTDLQILMLH